MILCSAIGRAAPTEPQPEQTHPEAHGGEPRHGLGVLARLPVRRTHATLMDQENAAIADRIAQMGHSALAMTIKYTSADIERRRGIVELVSALIHGSGGREPSGNQG